ncbi:MAG: hypothetical protein SGARI_003969 [Bacillariaceae sp.]
MMGFSYNEDETPVMCFNAAKNYQLGWYSNQQASLNPSTFASQTITMNGIDDYGDDSNNIVVLRIEGSPDHYVGYNRATGINEGTLEGQNEITVVSKSEGPLAYGESTLRAKLSQGEEYGVANGVTVRFVSTSNGGKDAVVEVSGTGSNGPNSTPNPTPQPTPQPTPAPTPNPTPAPAPGPPGNCDDTKFEFKLELNIDNWGEDISWELKQDGVSSPVADGDGYGNADNTVKEETACIVSDACFTFDILDSYGDGLTTGGYIGYLDGIAIPGFSGSDYGDSDQQKVSRNTVWAPRLRY